MKQRGTCMMARVLVTILCGAASTSLADLEIKPRAVEAPAATRETQAGKRWRDQDARAEGERIIDRLVANTQVMEQLGVTAEAVNHMRDDLREVQTRANDLENRLRQLSLEQAEQMKRFFQSKEVGTNVLMNLAEELGRVRTDQAKLTIQRMVVIRKYLTADQIKQAREMMHERMTKERETRGEANVKQEQRRERAAAAAQPVPPLTKPPEGW